MWFYTSSIQHYYKSLDKAVIKSRDVHILFSSFRKNRRNENNYWRYIGNHKKVPLVLAGYLLIKFSQHNWLTVLTTIVEQRHVQHSVGFVVYNTFLPLVFASMIRWLSHLHACIRVVIRYENISDCQNTLFYDEPEV